MPTDPRSLRSQAPLLDAWLRFQESGPTAYTIPGHKHRRDLVGDVIAGDVPLYAGLDTMKLDHGVLADAQLRAARAWGADRCWFSVGGSTHANQAIALGATRPGDQVVMSRTSHRSMMSALVLADLHPVWLPSRCDQRTGMPLPATATDLEETLAGAPQARAVLVVDPAYVGTTGSVAALARVAHDHTPRGVPLVIDAAWAAHFGWHPDLPPHPLAAGADAMVTSAHKTLPAWSQAALLLAQADRLDLARVEAGVDAIHTTSQSGAILASIDAARALLEAEGASLLDAALRRVAQLRARWAGIPGLTVLDGPGVDPLKVCLILAGTGADGNEIEADLLAEGMPVEMADRDTVVAMVTLADDDASLDRLAGAVEQALRRRAGPPRPVVAAGAWSVTPEQVLSPREAFFAARRSVPWAQGRGRVSAELVAPYPPGIPILAPGERITDEVVAALAAARAAGTRIAYAADPSLASVQVVS